MSELLKQAVADLRAQLDANSSKIDALVERARTPHDADMQAAIDDIRRMIEENRSKLEAADAAMVQG